MMTHPLSAPQERSLQAFSERGEVPGLGPCDAPRNWNLTLLRVDAWKLWRIAGIRCLCSNDLSCSSGRQRWPQGDSMSCGEKFFNVYQTLSQQSSCVTANFWLASVHVHFLFLSAGCWDQPGFQGQPLGLCQWGKSSEWQGAWPSLSPAPWESLEWSFQVQFWLGVLEWFQGSTVPK